MRGIILAGGSGTRLHPATLAIKKQLLPVYDKPMIYYPLSALMLAGIRDVLIISSPEYLDNYRRLFGSGDQYGLRIEYAPQAKPEGLAQAFHLGADFVGDQPAALVLGDNIFFGAGFCDLLVTAKARRSRATIFAYRVNDPTAYGVVALDLDGRAISIEKKPIVHRSDLGVTGLYFYDNRVIELARQVRPSGRGDNLVEASEFMKVMQKRTGTLIACLEEIAFRQGFIGQAQLRDRGILFETTDYGQALLALADDH